MRWIGNARRGPSVTHPYRRVVHYMVQRGLTGEHTLLDGDLTLVEASRRNANLKVMQLLGPSYLLKQGVDADTRQTVAHEAAMYVYIAALPENCELRRYFVHCQAYEVAEHILILELLPEARSLNEEQATSGRFSRHLAGDLGRALAACHSAPCPCAELPQERAVSIQFPLELPWALSLHRPSLSNLTNLSRAQRELLKVVQQYPDYCAALDDLRAGWRRDTLIHGDLRWDNVLVVRTAPATRTRSRREVELKLVDWELADIGDACWDLGAALAEYLRCWVFSMPITGGLLPEQMMGLARRPLEAMQPAIRALWAAYRQQMAPSDRGTEEVLNRSVEYAAARLLQTASEHLHRASSLTGHAVTLLQLSANILQAPEEAALHLLGIPPVPGSL